MRAGAAVEMKQLVSEPTAFIGHRSKSDSMWCRYDSHTLSCGVALKYRLFLLLPGAVFGPGLTAAWLWPRHDPKSLHQIPLLPLCGLLIMVVVAWLICIRMLVYRRTIWFNFGSGEIVFSSRDLFGSRRQRVTIEEVIGIEVSSISRLRTTDMSDSSANRVACYYATITKADGEKTRLFETTNAERVREVLAILTRHGGCT